MINLEKKLELKCIHCGELCLTPLKLAKRPVCIKCHKKGKIEVKQAILNMKKAKEKPKRDKILEKQARALSKLINKKKRKVRWH